MTVGKYALIARDLPPSRLARGLPPGTAQENASDASGEALGKIGTASSINVGDELLDFLISFKNARLR